MIVLSSKWLKIFIKASPVNAGFYMTTENHISFVTDLAANFGYNRFRIMPETVSKLLRLATWNLCAVWLESPVFLGKEHISIMQNLLINK